VRRLNTRRKAAHPARLQFLRRTTRTSLPVRKMAKPHSAASSQTQARAPASYCSRLASIPRAFAVRRTPAHPIAADITRNSAARNRRAHITREIVNAALLARKQIRHDAKMQMAARHSSERCNIDSRVCARSGSRDRGFSHRPNAVKSLAVQPSNVRPGEPAAPALPVRVNLRTGTSTPRTAPPYAYSHL
jgi:hypothetical protein